MDKRKGGNWEAASKLVSNFTHESDPDNWELLDKLGEGAFGAVYKGRNKKDNRVVAVKIIELQDSLDDVVKEIEILSKCKHFNVVGYQGCCSDLSKDRKSLWILLEYCGAGSIRGIIEQCEQVLTEPQIAAIIRGTLEGLQFMHSKGILHRDIKAANILLTEDGIPKLADFGVSHQLSSTLSKRNTVIGTPLWMSPEVIKGVGYDLKADIWSLGITVIECAEGLPPYSDEHPMRAMFKIPFAPEPTLSNPNEFSSELNDFIKCCCTKDPKLRKSAKELLQHPFIMKHTKNTSDPVVELIQNYKKSVETEKSKPKEKEPTYEGPRGVGDHEAFVMDTSGFGGTMVVNNGTGTVSSMSSDTTVIHGTMNNMETTRIHDTSKQVSVNNGRFSLRPGMGIEINETATLRFKPKNGKSVGVQTDSSDIVVKSIGALRSPKSLLITAASHILVIVIAILIYHASYSLFDSWKVTEPNIDIKPSSRWAWK